MASGNSETTDFDTYFLSNAASSDLVCASLNNLWDTNNRLEHAKVGCGSLSADEKTLPKSAPSSETPF